MSHVVLNTDNQRREHLFSFTPRQTLAEILTFNSVGTQLLFLGCNQGNNQLIMVITLKAKR